MSFPFFIVYLVVHCVLLVWAFVNEDKLIAFEQKIIRKIRRNIVNRRRRKKLSVVEPNAKKQSHKEHDPYRGYVA